MINTYSQRKRSEIGASLIMLVSIIGLAFVVTVAAFLVSASNGQNTARLASAKVDIANREDALMREVLQQTATGMLPGTDGATGPILTWTQIMTAAATNLDATSYVDPVEIAALPGLAGVIPSNMGDTAGTLLGLFQGYNNTAVPFGGTSGLANVVSPYNGTVQPPLMNWSGNSILSSTLALTTPEEFFLGSQYTALSASVTKLSSSNRWGKISYPNIRFGYKQAGNAFIARQVWWRIPVVYQTAQQTLEDQTGVTRYPSAPANYVLSVYEIPSQLPISGNANLQIGNNVDGSTWGSTVTIAGSIYGEKVQVFGGIYGANNSGISSRTQVNLLNPATVGGVSYPTSNNTLFDQVGTREQMALTQTPGAAAPVSVAANDGKLLLVPVLQGSQFYMPATSAPTHWDLYARPYYRCRIRIKISGTNSVLNYNPSITPQINPTAGAINVSVSFLPDPLIPAHPDQILGFLDTAATIAPGSPYSQANTGDPFGSLPAYMTYTSTGTGSSSDRNVLLINIAAMVNALGSPAQLYSIYVGTNPTTMSDPGIAITGTNNLSQFTAGLSIVSNLTLYMIDSFNQVLVPATNTLPATSVYAPTVLYGISGVNPTVALTGQISIDPASTSSSIVSPLSFSDADGTPISTSSATNAFTLKEITDPTVAQMPPITRLTLLFTIEKERTN
jgi:hypothetical protein